MTPAQATAPVQAFPAKLGEVLKLAELGWNVHPCRPRDKKPLTKWKEESSFDPEKIRSWAARWTGCNWAVDCGKSGLLVIDCDKHNPTEDGEETWRAFEARYGRVDKTPLAQTGGGGWHIYFKAPPGLELKNSAGRLGPGIDVRTDGGYAIVSPSVHESGTAYSWVEGLEPWTIEPAEAPEWLVRLLRGETPQDARQRPSGVRSDDEATIPQGRRNDELFRLASSLRAKGLTPAGIEAALQEENRLRCEPPLPVGEVRTIAGSAGKYRPGTSIDPERQRAVDALKAAGIDPASVGLEEEDDPLQRISAAIGVEIAQVVELRTPTSGEFILKLRSGREVNLGGGKELLSYSAVSGRLLELERITLQCRCKDWRGVVNLIAKEAEVEKVPDSIEEMIFESIKNFVGETAGVPLEKAIADGLGYAELLTTSDGEILLPLDALKRWIAVRQHENRLTRRQLADVLARFGFRRDDLYSGNSHRRFWRGRIPTYAQLVDW